MHYIFLMKFREKPTKDALEKLREIRDSLGTSGRGLYVTMGGYDVVWHIEAEDNKKALETTMRFSDLAFTETMPAIPLDEAIQMKF
jgi:uncharacterized protein with GYD domain